VVNYLKLSDPLKLILDVGCGTGHSTQAFAAMAEKIIGIDHSEAMLAVALKGENITYLQESAEKIDQLNMTPDMIIAGQSFHWFDRSKFFKNAQQILKHKGHVIVFTHAIDHPELVSLNRDFPRSFKLEINLKEEAKNFGFIQRDHFFVHEKICLTKIKILNHLRTLSSVENAFKADSNLAALMLAKYFATSKDDEELSLTSSSEVWILQKD